MARSPIDIAIAALRASDRPLTLKELMTKAKVTEGDASPSNAGDLGSAVALTKEFLNGYAAALKHLEKKEAA